MEIPDLLQYAIKGRRRQNPMAHIYNALRAGEVRILRVMNEEEHEWDAQEPTQGCAPGRGSKPKRKKGRGRR